MNRLFSVRRRRPSIVDLYTPVDTPGVSGVTGYRLKWAQNFDSAEATIITSDKVGFVDSNVPRNSIESQPFHGREVRIVFDPATYAIDDTKAFWLRFYPMIGAAEQTPGALTLVLPDQAHHGLITQVIAGTAPAAELQLDLPLMMENVNLVNSDAAVNLLVGTEEGGPKHIVLPLNDQYLGFNGAVHTMFVQGDGGTVDFSANFTLCFPR